MKVFEVVLSTVRDIVMALVVIGLISAIAGVLILIYPDLLGILVGIALLLSALVWFIFAAKLYKYSKVKVEL